MAAVGDRWRKAIDITGDHKVLTELYLTIIARQNDECAYLVRIQLGHEHFKIGRAALNAARDADRRPSGHLAASDKQG